MPWLNLAGLKSFTCAIPLPGDTPSGRVMEYIATCEALEELEVRVIYRAERDFGKQKFSRSGRSYSDQVGGSSWPSHYLVDPFHRSHKVAHPEVLFRTPSLVVLDIF